jgi:hypothetical protein
VIRSPLPSEVLARYNTFTKYPNFYDNYLVRYRYSDAVLVIGIDNGEFLRALKEYHPYAEIVGIDCDSRTLIWEKRIHSAKINYCSEKQLQLFADSHVNHFSVIIGRGSKSLENQLLLFKTLYKSLLHGGMSSIENITFSEYATHFEVLGLKAFDLDVTKPECIVFKIKDAQ